MKNQSGAIKTNLELYRVVMGGSGGYRRLKGGSDDFSLQTYRQTLHHNIYIIIIFVIIIVIIIVITILNIIILANTRSLDSLEYLFICLLWIALNAADVLQFLKTKTNTLNKSWRIAWVWE